MPSADLAFWGVLPGSILCVILHVVRGTCIIPSIATELGEIPQIPSNTGVFAACVHTV